MVGKINLVGVHIFTYQMMLLIAAACNVLVLNKIKKKKLYLINPVIFCEKLRLLIWFQKLFINKLFMYGVFI